MKFNDAIIGVLLVALGLTVLAVVQSYPLIPGQKYGPDIFPGLVGCGLSITGIQLVWRGFLSRHVQPWIKIGDWAGSKSHVSSLLVVVVGVVAYIYLSELVGFIPFSWVILFALMLCLRVNFYTAIGMSLVMTILVHLAFYKFLRVPLPWGILLPVAW